MHEGGSMELWSRTITEGHCPVIVFGVRWWISTKGGRQWIEKDRWNTGVCVCVEGRGTFEGRTLLRTRFLPFRLAITRNIYQSYLSSAMSNQVILFANHSNIPTMPVLQLKRTTAIFLLTNNNNNLCLYYALK